MLFTRPVDPLPSLSDFAPLCEAIRPMAFAGLVTAQACGELRFYRPIGSPEWQVWLEARGERVTLARWAIEWATRRAITGAS